MSVSIRQATENDIAIIVAQRRAMFEDMQVGEPAVLDEMVRLYPAWLRPKLASGEYVGWFIVDDEHVVAGIGIWFMEWQPSPRDASPKRGYLLNVYTEQAYRGKGLAKQLVQKALDTCREEGALTVSLHASSAGEPIYRSFGFQTTNEMKLRLD